MDRRDFLTAWIQALLLAIFPFLRARPLEQSAAIAEAIVDKMPAVIEYGWWANYVMWNMVRGYDLRWQIGQNEAVLDELLARTPYTPTNTNERATPAGVFHGPPQATTTEAPARRLPDVQTA